MTEGPTLAPRLAEPPRTDEPEPPTEAFRLTPQLAEPGRFWIRWRPRVWPGPGPPRRWTDLAAACLGVSAPEGAIDFHALALPDPAPDDVVYLPPVAAAQEPARRALAARLAAAGTPVLFQLAPGDPPATADLAAVWDLLEPLLAGDLSALSRLPAGAVAAWPLVAGLTDADELCAAGCARLAAAGAAAVQGLALELSPAEKRGLAEGRGEEVFRALFHGGAPSERAFASHARAHGLAVFAPRPLPPAPAWKAGNRRLGGRLALAAELWLRLGRPEGPAQALYRAARWADGETHDVARLAREGHLGLVPALDDTARRLLAEAADPAGAPGLLDELAAAYAAVD